MFMDTFNYRIKIQLQKLLIGVLSLALFYAAYDNKAFPFSAHYGDIVFGFGLCMMLGYIINNLFALSHLFTQQENFEKFQKSYGLYNPTGHFPDGDFGSKE
jgi:hypothetical protein